MEEISFEEFKRVELRVARIREASRVEGSEKLLKLSVELGAEKRQIIAGIGKAYSPEEIIGKEIVVVANLAPRMLMGHESQGMLLCADAELPVLLAPSREVLPGSSIL
ncbi:MAG: methionine--tRNA ligase subunit beta [Candidatus Sungbacteria bacterium RIFCSPLOWO2_02_FULL_47_9]|uniref:Methionine--tRNA ligase n=1 Tax=Candidatus Sungbacteria bacterium RIFCSPHIGHO2_01_FULL_47_32 TaxID=1802264 RepID=A0A1G2K541_9BACT|nr:MAG: Methionyl-tRNA synthetase, beta subunit [Parcubacteria group bacterium GW2011_GWA2_47_10]OGZ93610.1 MAG: methionine--tRNA ligase subunit beta [Candidatus Sungbacteria bacterium RIFCSPHIGHO2_01_FULL_47_32]OHA05452.1 MAG: methionine--tRNA ligase subunit beta [Candidatus Sungbacteria bacterium RIFCSPLOWO2_01_FULL_47_32]OHA08668.1 MAG: methionine--tRNA ligase subunit beta [Candidatus Sungbacteria bacterium RIFCSPLOWO2_02_FULL_47_9]